MIYTTEYLNSFVYVCDDKFHLQYSNREVLANKLLHISEMLFTESQYNETKSKTLLNIIALRINIMNKKYCI